MKNRVKIEIPKKFQNVKYSKFNVLLGHYSKANRTAGALYHYHNSKNEK